MEPTVQVKPSLVVGSEGVDAMRFLPNSFIVGISGLLLFRS